MKQKIVIRVCMCCDKSRSKALKLAAATCGVDSVALEGKHRDEVVVVGDDVDSTRLTCELRKKIGHADIQHVSEVVVKKADDKKPPPPPAAKPPPPPPPAPPITFVWCQCHHYHYHHHHVGDVCPWCGGRYYYYNY